MATVKTTSLVDGFKGKVGGSTLQYNNGGLIMRAIKPSCRTSLYTDNMMKNVTPTISGLWKTLTNAQRATWSANAASYPSFDKWGNSRTPAAYNLFVNLNASLARAGFAPVLSLAAPATLTDETGFSVATSGSNWDMTLPAALAPSEIAIAYATPAFTPGRTIPQGYWRYMLTITPGMGTTFLVSPEWEAAFGNSYTGLIIWWSIIVYNTTVGNRSNRYIVQFEP